MICHHQVSQGPNLPGTTTIWSPQILAVAPELDHARGVRRHLSSMRCPIPNPRALAHEVLWNLNGETFRILERGVWGGQSYHSPRGIGHAGKSHTQKSHPEVLRWKSDECAHTHRNRTLLNHTHPKNKPPPENKPKESALGQFKNYAALKMALFRPPTLCNASYQRLDPSPPCLLCNARSFQVVFLRILFAFY